MKKRIGIMGALCSVVLLAACAESPTETPKAESAWVYEGQWGSRGSGNGEFINPFGVAVAPGGNVYVVDTDNDRVQYFTRTGSFLGKWGKNGDGNGQFLYPEGAAIAPNGNVYVSDWGNDRVQYFAATGSFLGKWGSYGTGNGQFEEPKTARCRLVPRNTTAYSTSRRRGASSASGGATTRGASTLRSTAPFTSPIMITPASNTSPQPVPSWVNGARPVRATANSANLLTSASRRTVPYS